MLGSFGDIIFETSDERLLNFEGFKRDTASVYENHKLMGQKPRTEFVAPGLDTVTFTVILRSRFGVKPRDEMNRWLEYARNGNAEILEIGGRALGVDKWVVTSTSQHWDTVYNRGELVSGKVDVTLQEYVSTMWTVKAYQERLKKLEAGKDAVIRKEQIENNRPVEYNEFGLPMGQNSVNQTTGELVIPQQIIPLVAPSSGIMLDIITNNTTCIKPVGMIRPAMIHYIMKKLNSHKAYSAAIDSERLLTIERMASGTNDKTTYKKQLSRVPVMIKGMEVIDTQDIIDKFGSTNEIADLVSHLPGVDSFAFAEHAAIGFLLKYNGQDGPFVSTIWENDYNMYVFESPEEIKSSSDKPTFSIAGSVALVYTDISSIDGTIPTPITDLDVFYVGPGSVLMKKPGTDKGPGNNISYESALSKALRLTAAFEGGGVTGNFDGQGLSIGMFQFNFGQKSLQPLLLDMISQYPDLMKSIFGANYDKLDTILKSSYSDQMIWVKSINDGNSKIIEPWKMAFTTLNNGAELNSIQLNSAKFQTYVTQTKSIVDTYNLKTERGIALAFDISIQNWGTNGDVAFISEILAMTNESDKLQAISDRVINKSSSEYQADVKSRKYTIVNGTGTVHGIQYNLSDSKYDILARVWY